MHEFPPKPDDQVTLANWRTAPFNQWAFQHVREVIPSADIANDPAGVREFPANPVDLSGLPLTNEGQALDFEGFLERTATDGFVVLHKGKLVCEHYAHGMTEATPHILMSVSKSMLGLLVGILIDQKVLNEEALVTDYMPELADTAYAGATIRHLLDMRAGIEFDEDYLITSGPIVDYRKATNWNPLQPGDVPSDLRSFFLSLTSSDGPHEGRFHYVSPNTDLLAWIIERAAGQRYADLMSDYLWRPMGAGTSGYITVDRLGAPRAAGGMCVTTRDLALVGQLLIEKGRRGQNQIVPEAWIDDLETGGDAQAWKTGDFVDHFPGLPIRYRSKWYVLEESSPILFCLGIHGQYLFVDRENEISIAKHSSRGLPLDEGDENLAIQAALAIRERLI
ncbi:MAG: serine hydrolase [Alphaproteobacteria bacterium]|jgi:CubicO group peptidase (beta-lactamase class C family)|nr:serine hydrolase [Alphaproteobacteria bacterium]MBT4084918.1 serine hydrolase [Alphaproteobacteria bacterium]MBT4542295.1 serine hydrolase [Alphaproteobacteria bacterium]MBT7746128.1 serine hydrolase [Alphaproteobacteria bacterium]